MRNKLRIIAFIVAIIVFAVGVIMATAESKKIDNLKESCTEAVGGTCISCVLESRGIKRNRHRSYYNVTASYEVNGVTYTTSGRSDRLYETREPIGVHYNPSNPSESYTGTAPLNSNNLVSTLMLLAAIPCVVFALINKRVDKWS